MDGGSTHALATQYAPDHASTVRCGSRWHVAQTYAQAEHWALANLTRQGFNAYLPMQRVLRPDRVLRTLIRPVTVPLFSSYLFVALDDQHWTPIKYTRGICRFLYPQHLPNGTVEMLQATEARRTEPRTDSAAWHPGQPCTIATGPLAGHEAAVVSIEPRAVHVALVILGQMRTVSVAPDALIERAV